MNVHTSRNPNLVDAMVLVAATALGVSTWRGCRWDPSAQLTLNFAVAEGFRQPWSRDWIVIGISMWVRNLIPLLTIETMAIHALRLRRPRPKLARLYRQPGAVAGLAASVVTGIIIPACIAFRLTFARRSVPLDRFLFNLSWNWRLDLDLTALRIVLIQSTSTIGCAILAAWALLAITGRWRAETDWLDRIGRLLACVWIALLPFFVPLPF